MQKLQLYVSDTRLDLFNDETVTISQSIQNIKDPSKIFTEFSKSFTIPCSKTNNKVFQHYENFNIVSGFDARQKTSARIELNYIPFKQGYVKLEGVELKLNKPYAYKIVFYGETVNIKDLLKDDKLAALSTLDNYNLAYDASTIKARLQSSSGPILCPLITSGASNEGSELTNLPSRLYYNSQSGGSSDLDGNLYYKSSGSGGHAHGVLYSDLKYAIRIKEVIDAITARYPTLVFSNDFFNTSNAEFYNLYIWLHRKKGSVEEATQGGSAAKFPSPVTGFGLPQQYTTMLNSNTLEVYASCNPYNPTTACPNTALPSITQQLILNTSSSVPYDVIIFRNGVAWAQLNNNVGNSSFGPGDMGIMDEASYTITIYSYQAITFTNGSSVGIQWNLSGYIPGAGGGWSESYTIASFTASASFTFEISQQIPDMKIIDFLTGLFKLFNLTAYFDDRPQLANGNTNLNYQKIRIQKLEDFYTTDVATYDITEYVDVNTSSVDLALPYKEINFAYEGNDTFLAKQYEQLNGKLWGAEDFTGDASTGGDFFDAPNTTYDIKAPFEHVLFERLVDVDPTLVFPNNLTTIQYGYFVDDNQDAYLGKPLLFYPIHQPASSATEISFKPTASTHESLTNYFIPSNSIALSSSTNNKNLNFYAEFNEYGAGSNPPDNGFIGTLIYENYLTYIRDIFTEKRRITKIKAYLPLRIIYNIKMNDTLTIQGQEYKINTISTNLITGESDIELLNEV